MQNRHYEEASEFNLKINKKLPAIDATFIIADFFCFEANLFLNKGMKILFNIATGKQLTVIRSFI
jgi:hypothetical protein